MQPLKPPSKDYPELLQFSSPPPLLLSLLLTATALTVAHNVTGSQSLGCHNHPCVLHSYAEPQQCGKLLWTSRAAIHECSFHVPCAFS